MMDDILKQIKAGEVSGMQFKERILDKYDIACELVAFSNSQGGKLVVGIKDKTGEINALSYSEVQETTNLLSDIASENVVPSILIKIDTVEVEDGNLVVATVKEGLNKPYHDNKGIVWVKNGADKRKVFDNAELAEMMTDCGSFAPDEAGVRDATVNDLDATTIKQFLGNRFERVLEKKGLTGDAFNEASLDAICSAIAKVHDCEKILRNLRFIRPDLFIPMAEESGAIHKIGLIVLEKVCRFISSDEFKKLGLDYIEVNLSVVQCMDKNLADKILSVCRRILHTTKQPNN